MKKIKIIIPAIFSVIVIGLLSGYFIYSSTLIDITNEKSISDNISSVADEPITIIKTAQNGDYYGILYTDPTDKDEGYCHFRYITKAKLYKNKYHNIGGSATGSNDSEINYDILNARDEDDKTVQVFLYTFSGNLFESKKCSVFEYNAEETEIDFDEITDEEQIIEKRQKLANSYKKIDEFDLPNEEIYIIPKSYELSQADNQISFVNGSVPVKDMKEQIAEDADLIVKEYREYLKEAKEWKKQ